MKNIHLKKISLAILIGLAGFVALAVNGCAESQKVKGKSGAQLWAENCQRCHNTPSPASFSHDQWTTIGMHMQTRAMITDEERDKIVAFLRQ
jgi:hypothetical protein